MQRIVSVKKLTATAWFFLLSLYGCHARPCTEASCPADTYCEISGACQPVSQVLEDSESDKMQSFSRVRRTPAGDWASTERGRISESVQTFNLGDQGRVAYLAFPSPDFKDLLRATLVVHPSDVLASWMRFRVQRTSAFRGDLVSRMKPPRRHGKEVQTGGMRTSRRRPVRIDITSLVRSSKGDPVLHVALSANGNSALVSVDSPDHPSSSRRPVLELSYDLAPPVVIKDKP